MLLIGDPPKVAATSRFGIVEQDCLRTLRRFNSSIVVCLIVFTGRFSTAAGPPQRVAVDAPSSVAKQFAVAAQSVESRNWIDASDRLVTLMESSPNALLEVEPGRYVRCLNWANQLIARWPDEGLTAYRSRVDTRALSEFESAVAENDHSRIRNIADRYPHATIGTQAIESLAHSNWREGDIDQARHNWERLAADATAAASQHRRAQILSSLILCSIVEHDLDRARSELVAFEQQFPDAQGRIGRTQGRLAELLSAAIESTSSLPIQTRSQTFFTGRGGRRQRQIESFGPLVWTRNLASTTGTESPDDTPQRSQNVFLPVADGKHLYLTEVERVRGLRLADGNPTWPTEQSGDDGTLFQGPAPIGMDLAQIGLPTLTATLSGGLLFTVPGRCVRSAPPEVLPLLTPRLVALDIDGGEGRLVWSQGLEGALARADWMPAGAPVARRSVLWLPVQRSQPPFDIGLARLRSSDGSVEWVCPIGSTFSDESRATVHFEECWVSVAGNQVFLLSPSGIMAAIEAERGHVRWLATYDTGNLSDRDLSHPDKNRASAPQFHRGMVVASSGGTGDVFAWNASTGELLWRSELHERGLQVCGVSGDLVIATGRRLYALDTATGRPVWRVGFEDEDGAGAGPAAVSGSRVVWSTRRDLFLIDTATGTILDRIALRDRYGLSGGPLLVAGDRLILVNPGRLAAVRVAGEDD